MKTKETLHPFSSKPLPADRPVPCRHCPRSYKAVNVRDLHERIHLTPYICDYCKQSFALKSHIRNHLEIHRRMIDPWQKVKKNSHTIRFKDDASRFSCEFCEKQFYSKLGYTSHLRQKHYEMVGDRSNILEPEPIFIKEEEDEDSDFDFTDEENIENNSKTRDFVCSCGDKFSEFIDLVRHESSKHTDGFEKMVKGLKDLLLYVINRVDNDVIPVTPKREKVVPIKKEEIIEVEPIVDDFHHDNETSEPEPIIVRKEKSPNNKTKKTRPVESPKKIQKLEKYLCQYCDKQLSHKKSLEYHVAKKHQKSPIFRCKLCNRYFTDEEEYQTHTKSHDNDPELCCSSCGFLCKGAAVLRRHVAQKHKTSEQQEPRFFCDSCGKGFYYKCKLDEHAIIHKPQEERAAIFGCDICNMVFTRKSALNRHKLSHDESTKIFTCIFCSKTFRRKQHLDAHLAMHTGARAREEICKDCGAIYSERRGLYNHMLRVHGRPLEGYKKQNSTIIVTQNV